MAVFKAFKPEAMNKIAQSMGFSGNMREFESFIEQDPARQARMKQFTNAAMQMAKGGVVKMQQGGLQVGGNMGGPGPLVNLQTGETVDPRITAKDAYDFRYQSGTMANMAGNRPGSSPSLLFPGEGSSQSVNLLTGEMAPPPDYSGMTYQQAQTRQAQRDVKSPAEACLLYTSPSPRDGLLSRMPSSA